MSVTLNSWYLGRRMNCNRLQVWNCFASVRSVIQLQLCVGCSAQNEIISGCLASYNALLLRPTVCFSAADAQVSEPQCSGGRSGTAASQQVHSSTSGTQKAHRIPD